MMMDVDQAARAIRDAEIEDFLEGFNQPTYRGMRINGQRVTTWSVLRRVHELVVPAVFETRDKMR